MQKKKKKNNNKKKKKNLTSFLISCDSLKFEDLKKILGLAIKSVNGQMAGRSEECL